MRAGLGYLDFATARPALFRLIFSSAKPDTGNPALHAAAGLSDLHLVGLVKAMGGGDADIIALWARGHGIADLVLGGKLRELNALPEIEREAMARTVLIRMLPTAS